MFGVLIVYFSLLLNVKTFLFIGENVSCCPTKKKGENNFLLPPENRLLNIQKITIFHLLVLYTIRSIFLPLPLMGGLGNHFWGFFDKQEGS